MGAGQVTAGSHNNRRGLGQQRGFRATDAQNRYLEAIKAKGGSISDEISDMVDLYMELEHELGEEGVRRMKAAAMLEGVSVGVWLGRLAKSSTHSKR